VLPPVEFNGVILRAISRLSGSSITTAVFVHVARRSTARAPHMAQGVLEKMNEPILKQMGKVVREAST